MVESIVGEILAEDVLREPMEQMRVAFSDWLPENRGSLPAADAARYDKQADIVGRICKEYERGNTQTAHVMALLQEMHDTGAPPPEVMSQLGGQEGAEGAAAGIDGLGAVGMGAGERAGDGGEGDLPQDCPVQ